NSFNRAGEETRRVTTKKQKNATTWTTGFRKQGSGDLSIADCGIRISAFLISDCGFWIDILIIRVAG
ncbi:MAG: hypothetical protein KAQ81_15230, partial [Deltaproteobacteria bacterium]|nr:hypothetical protein [Deltaproteobacteria bacterium]